MLLLLLLIYIVLDVMQVRKLSYQELEIFEKRWQKAVDEDVCWVDPFQ